MLTFDGRFGRTPRWRRRLGTPTSGRHALRDRAAHGTPPTCGMVLSPGATGRRGRSRTSVALDDQRRVVRGPSARCADRRSAFQAVFALHDKRGVQEAPIMGVSPGGGLRPASRPAKAAKPHIAIHARGTPTSDQTWSGGARRRARRPAGPKPAPRPHPMLEPVAGNRFLRTGPDIAPSSRQPIRPLCMAKITTRASGRD